MSNAKCSSLVPRQWSRILTATRSSRVSKEAKGAAWHMSAAHRRTFWREDCLSKWDTALCRERVFWNRRGKMAQDVLIETWQKIAPVLLAPAEHAFPQDFKPLHLLWLIDGWNNTSTKHMSVSFLKDFWTHDWSEHGFKKIHFFTSSFFQETFWFPKWRSRFPPENGHLKHQKGLCRYPPGN